MPSVADALTQKSKVELEREFKALAETWRRETAFLSFARQKVMHPAYQKIIGMGQDALPLILKELQTNGGDWIWALEMITRTENPAAGKTKFQDTVEAWLTWGKAHGFAS